MLLEELLLPPNQAQIEVIKKEIREDSDRYIHNLKLLEKWIECESYLPKKFDKNLLSVFLRCCKHDVEATKKKLENFFLVRKNHFEFFKVPTFNKEEEKQAHNLLTTVMPSLTDEGYRITFYGLRDPDTSLYDLRVTMIVTGLYGTIRSCKETMFSGEVYIIDCKNFTAAHAPKVLIPILKTNLYIFQEALPYRIRKIFLINVTPMIDHIISAIKLMLKEKLRKRVFVDRGTDILKILPKRCLPKDFGGDEISLNELTKKWGKCLQEEHDWLKEQENLKMIGEIPKRLKNCDLENGLGLQGSFRQLNID